VGNIYVADNGNNTIREISPTGLVTTLAGLAGGFGSNDGIGSAAQFSKPAGMASEASGVLYVADSGNSTIRKISTTGAVTTMAGLAGVPGSADGTGSEARFNNPQSVAVDTSGNVFVADTSNHTIRKITPGGLVTTLAGLAQTPGNDDGVGSSARFNNPGGVGVDLLGNVYVADSDNNTVRKISQEGVVTTLAGCAGCTMAGSQDGTNWEARFSNPQGVAADSSGNVYVTDWNSALVRKITPTGVVTTLNSGRPNPFISLRSVAVDASSNVYVADSVVQAIFSISPAGAITALAGQGGLNGSDDGTGNQALFYTPRGVAVDALGNVYVADYGNNAIRKGIPVPSLTALKSTVNGQFEFHFDSILGRNYTIQYSTFLSNWVSLSTMTGSGGLVSFVDSNAVDPQRFYRLQMR